MKAFAGMTTLSAAMAMKLAADAARPSTCAVTVALWVLMRVVDRDAVEHIPAGLIDAQRDGVDITERLQLIHE